MEDDDAGEETGTERDEDDGNDEEERGRKWEFAPSFFIISICDLAF